MTIRSLNFQVERLVDIEDEGERNSGGRGNSSAPVSVREADNTAVNFTKLLFLPL